MTFYFTHKNKTRVVGEAFAREFGAELSYIDNLNIANPCACYGILDGTELIVQNCKNFYYLDHGWFGKSSDIKKVNGYVRICRNSITPRLDGDFPWDRFESFGFKFDDWRKSGEHIILVPPSGHISKLMGLSNWTENTINELKKYTDRRIILSDKSVSTPNAFDLFKNAWALVTFHSGIHVQALIRGIPVITTYDRYRIGELSQIESPPLERDFLRNIAYQQFTLDEIRNDYKVREFIDRN